MSPEIITPEIPFIQDRLSHFLQQTILNPSVAKRLAPPLEIAETPFAKRQKKDAREKAKQQVEDSNFTTAEVNSLLKTMFNGFATEDPGWNQDAMRASLVILPFIGLKKLYPGQIIEAYMEAVVTTLPSKREIRLEGGLEALIEAGMILIPHVSRSPNRKQIETEVIPVLRQQLDQRHSYTSEEIYKRLAHKINDLSNSLKTGLIKPIEIIPKDTTEIANKFRQFGEDLRHKYFWSEQSARLDSLVQEAIRDFGMNAIQITEMSGIPEYRIRDSIRRLKASGIIPSRNVYQDSLTLQVQELLGKGTSAQIADALGPGITKKMVEGAKEKLRERQSNQTPNSPKKEASPEERIIGLRSQGLSYSEIVDQLGIPITGVRGLTRKLIREGRIKKKTRGGIDLNYPDVIKAIEIDALVDQMQSKNPGITGREIARRLNIPTSPRLELSLQRLKVCRQVEALIAQEKTAQQIAEMMEIHTKKAEFWVARAEKLRDLQRNLSTPSPSTG